MVIIINENSKDLFLGVGDSKGSFFITEAVDDFTKVYGAEADEVAIALDIVKSKPIVGQ